MHPQAVPAPWLSYVIPVAVFAVVMALRWRRMSRARRLRLETLWILPALYLAIVGFTFAAVPPSAATWGWSVLALAIGAGIGWYRGRMMRITVDPETHALSQQASPAAFLLLAALFLLKMGSRAEMGSGGMQPGQAHGVSMATDIAMAFALGLIAVTRIEMTLRARRLLREARAVA
jgi:NAD/NADP transhydrogenase beta subunit